MKKIDRIAYGVALACMTICPAMSQVDKEVEVTQAFIPQVIPATKPMILPDLSDESYINPDIDYSITPISIHTEIDTTPYKAVEMDYWEYKRQKNYYAKLGVGLPLSAVADLYAAKNGDKGYKIGYLNFDGQFADIKNDYGVKCNAARSHFGAGVGGGLYIGRRVLEGSVNYDNDRWSRYATPVEYDEHPLYQRLGLDLRFGDDFCDLSSWNYSIFGGVEQMWSRSDYSNTTFESQLDFGRDAGIGALTLSAMFDYVGGNNDYSNITFGAGVGYAFELDRAKFSVGADLYSESVDYNIYATNIMLPVDYKGEKSKLYVAPNLNFDYSLSSTRVIAYVALESELMSNDFASLSSLNPYITPGLCAAESSLEYDLVAGFKGTIADERLGYDISGHYIRTNNLLHWAFVKYNLLNNDFVGSLSDQDCYSVAFATEYRPNPQFTFNFDGAWSKRSDVAEQLYSDCEPALELYLGGEYRVKSFGVALDCGLQSKRNCSVIDVNSTAYKTLSQVEIPTTVNLNISADYTLNNDMVLFADVTNILNDDLYEWVGYRGYGVGAMVGVKFEF